MPIWTPEAWTAASALALTCAGALVGYLIRIERLLTKLVSDAENFRASHSELWDQHNDLKQTVGQHGERIAVLEAHARPAH